MAPVLALTTGEPAGIGPELALMLVASRVPLAGRVVAIGDPDLLAQRARRLGLDIELPVLARRDEVPAQRPGVLPVWPVTLRAPATAGMLDAANAGYVLETLDVAIAACRDGRAQAMVTAPLHKGVIIEGGHPDFTGHTEYLRDACGVEDVVMMLATRLATPSGDQALRVALASVHLPLREVADAITDAGLTRVLRILDGDLKRYFAVAAPRIAVCGLNPHAGENGHLGREELEVIIPTLERLRCEGLRLDGPLPADTLFTPRHLDGIDAVLAMYHDQGLPVLKYAGFGRAANITLGLPIVRTSVDHGTALDLAGTGRADIGSLGVALEVAAEMARAVGH
ncbi:4-hydroxythreonine-4-phosphate dehydrogenase [Modicisalibacter muralis]|uniref:4-hydroxythreonine-4-phosphate dehydrogenase n=1 Tax=Modicisalibacter muralis TaxID=119000 RepID=A0A1G9IT08_9GAMM|nr:4-hydroxythreonine-4-phosphate dehydrogenase PdxA [Halomonas muralis]SDL28300.1 4-hydroxythreonine-4-phosphate dehydrogenase [Halomonas muralis]